MTLHLMAAYIHAGITKCYLTARTLIYWPRINNNIEDYINWCPTCIRLSLTLLGEPLINYDVPQGPWQKLNADFMDMDGKIFLFIIDYFSKYPFLFLMCSTTADAVINCLTELFALKGTPKKCY